MPIRPSERARYPKDWSAISLRIRERAEQRCECTGQCRDRHGDADGTRCDAPNGKHILRALEGPVYITWEQCEAGELETRFAGRGFAERAVKIVLTVAHLDHAPENCSDENLLAMCQRCHLRMDSELHQRNARATRRSHKARGDLFDEGID